MDFYKKFTLFSERNRKYILLFVIVSVVISLLGIIKIRINTDFSPFMPKDSFYMEKLDEMNSQYPSGQQISYMIKIPGDLNTEKIKNLKKITDEIKNTEGVLNIVGNIPDVIPVGISLIKTENLKDSDFSKIQNYLNMMEKNGYINKRDGDTYVYIGITGNSSDTKGTINNINGIFEKNSYDYTVTGDSYLQVKIFDYIMIIIIFLPPLAIITVLFFFRMQLGSIKATFFSMFPAIIGALWTLGFIGWTIKEISMVTVIIPIFIIVMGSADGLHFVSHYLDNLKKGKSYSVEETLRAVGSPMILTTVTTIAGFISLVFIKSEALSQMGFYASMGILFAGIATWIFLPALLFTINVKPRKHNKEINFNGKKYGYFRGYKIYIITFFIIFTGLLGMSMVKTDFNLLSFYKKSTEVRKSFEKINEISGKTIPVFVVFDIDKNYLDYDQAEKILELEEELKKSENINGVISVYDIIKSANSAIYKNENYPQNKAVSKAIFNMMKNLSKESISNFISEDGKTSRLVIFPKNFNNEVMNYIEKKIPETGMYAAGIPFVIKEMNDSIVKEQVISLLYAVLFVFIIIVAVQRNLRIALISIVPISVTLVMLFGFMGFTGIPLSIITSIMASLTIGIGIDYSIHYVSLYRYFKNKKIQNPEEEALKYVFRPILTNALGLSAGFSVMLFSPLLIHTYLTGLMWVSMILSSFLSITLLPELLKKHGNKK